VNLNFNTLWSDAAGKVAHVWQQVLSEFSQNTWTKPDTTWRPSITAWSGMTVSGTNFDYGWRSNTDQEVRFSAYAQFTLGGTPSPYVILELPFAPADGLYQHLHADVFLNGQNWTAGFSYVDWGYGIMVSPTGVTNWTLGFSQVIVSGTYLRA
jgi:hypothetical protein